MKALLIGIALIGSFVVAQASGLRAELEAWNKAVHKMMMKKDVAGLEKTMKTGVTADFVYIENGQKQNFSQMMENMKMGIGMMTKITKADSKILSLKESGNKATCQVQHMMEGTMVGPDKKSHTNSFIGTAEESYVKVNGKWKMAKMNWKAQKMLIDGKPATGM